MPPVPISSLVKTGTIVIWTYGSFLASQPPSVPDADDKVTTDRSNLGPIIAKVANNTCWIWCAAQLWFMWGSERYPETLEFPLMEQIGYAVSLAGIGLRLWAHKTLGRHFTFKVAIRKDHQLIKTGPYKLLRHPAYTGSLIMTAGTLLVFYAGHDLSSMITPAIFKHPAALTLGLGLTAWSMSTRIRTEEKAMREEFGDEWDRYSQSRWGLLPGLW